MRFHDDGNHLFQVLVYITFINITHILYWHTIAVKKVILYSEAKYNYIVYISLHAIWVCHSWVLCQSEYGELSVCKTDESKTVMCACVKFAMRWSSQFYNMKKYLTTIVARTQCLMIYYPRRSLPSCKKKKTP